MPSNDIELKEIKNVEIFATGIWNGDTFTDSDLDQIIDTFQRTKDKINPFLKIGHNEKQSLLAKDELPKAGLITNLRKVGSKILADFVDVPRKIFDVVKRKAFDKISSELFVNMEIEGVRHPFALKAVALLGGETPAVHDLNSIMNLFGNSKPGMVYKDLKNETKEYEFKNVSFSQTKEVNNMSEELMKKIGKLESELKSFQDENAELNKDVIKAEEENKEVKTENEEVKKENETLKEEKKAADIKNREEKVTLLIDQAVKDGEIIPAQKDFLYSLITTIQPNEEKKFTVKDKEFNSVEELAFAFIKAGKTEDLNTGEGSERGETNGGSDDAMIQKAEQYAEKNKVNFKEALIEISKKK